jgi:hypothetical protein
MNVSIPGDKEGYFGRTCPTCSKFFKVRVDEFKAAREAELLCAYCGHQAEHGEFMTPDQRKRAISAARAYAVAKIQDALGDAFKGTSRGSGGLLSISMEFKPGTPPRLHAYVEKTVGAFVAGDRPPSDRLLSMGRRLTVLIAVLGMYATESRMKLPLSAEH